MVDIEKFPNGGLWIPARQSGSDWALIALHGSGGSCQDFVGLEDILDIPQMNYLYLNGPITIYSNFRWYSSPENRQEAFRLLEQALDELAQKGYPPEKTFLLGFSQGASLTFEFGARYPHLLRGYIAISGRIEDMPGLLHQGNPSIIQQGNWLVTHGTKDYNLSIDIIRQQVEQLRNAGFHIDFQEYAKIHEFEANQELPYISEWIRSRM